MLKYLSMVVCMAWLGSLFGCSRKPKLMTIDQLAFPVIRILETRERQDGNNNETLTASRAYGHARVFATKEELGHIPVQELWNVTNPIVIDSNATVLDMTDIKNEHGGLWMMINPSGQMPVTFTLRQRTNSGIEAARGIIANCSFLGRDLDDERTKLRRERVRRANSGDELIQIISEVPPSNSINDHSEQ